MRRPLLVLALVVLGALVPGGAIAQPSPYGVGDERAAPAPGVTREPASRNTGANPEAVPWAKPPEDGSQMRAPQMLDSRPSGFWTSNRPARGGAYRWRIMAAGGVVFAITLFFVLRLLIRTARAGRLPTATALDRR